VFILLGYCSSMRPWLETMAGLDMLEGYAIVTYDLIDSCYSSTEDVGLEELLTTAGVWTLTAAEAGGASQADFFEEIEEGLSNPNATEYDFGPHLSWPFGTVDVDRTSNSDAATAFENSMFVSGGDTREFRSTESPGVYTAFMYVLPPRERKKVLAAAACQRPQAKQARTSQGGARERSERKEGLSFCSRSRLLCSGLSGGDPPNHPCGRRGICSTAHALGRTCRTLAGPARTGC
jgi:hypothetical protein